MHRLGGSLIRCGGSLSNPPVPASRCYHASLFLPFSDSKKKQRKRPSRKHGKNERQESMQDWLEQDSSSTESATHETTLLSKHAHNSNSSSSLPLEIWSELKSDPTFFHGRKGLALEWTLPSVHTSQHPGVKAILKDIQLGAPHAHVEEEEEVEEVDCSPETDIHVEDEVDWSDKNDEQGKVDNDGKEIRGGALA